MKIKNTEAFYNKTLIIVRKVRKGRNMIAVGTFSIFKQVNLYNDRNYKDLQSFNMSNHSSICALLIVFFFIFSTVPLKIVYRVHFSSATTLEIDKLRNYELERHNLYRSYHGVNPIQLNDSLNSAAQKYADLLANQSSGLVHSPEAKSGSYGENLYWKWASPSLQYTPGEASDSWYAQEKDYDYTSGTGSGVVGHFTAMIWDDVTDVGFGFAQVSKDSDGQQIYVVANYLPVPNWSGEESKHVKDPVARKEDWKDQVTKIQQASTAQLYGSIPNSTPSGDNNQNNGNSESNGNNGESQFTP